MKKYKVGIPYYATIFTTVVAKNKGKAIEEAYNNVQTSPCCYCSKRIQIDEAVTTDDKFQGSIEEIKDNED